MKKALITGVTGQDGAYLAHLLLQKGYKVFGAVRRNSGLYSWRLDKLGVRKDIEFVDFDLLEYSNIKRTLARVQPEEIYNLGAQSFVALSFEQPILTCDIDALGVVRLLEAVRELGLPAKTYQASTSEMFGKVQETPQSEKTPFYPRSPYAFAKLMAHWAMVNYRESYGMFNCSGILFNHESPLRGEEFVTRKITKAVGEIHRGERDLLEVGNLDAKRDWGYAREYVDAMWRMLNHSQPDDYVLATGETHSVREFVEAAFACAGVNLEWSGNGVAEVGVDRKTGKQRVRVSPKFFRPAEVDLLIGNCAKAQQKLGWRCQTSYSKLVEIMMKAELDPSASII